MPKKQLIILLVLVAILILGGVSYGSYYFWQKSAKNINQKTCTMEAKLCPNGSSVGRTGPNCEFAACRPNELQGLLDLNAEFKNFFKNVTEKYPELSIDKFIKKESVLIKIIGPGFSNFAQNNSAWTFSPDKSKAVFSLGYYGEPDSSLEIYNRNGDKKIELLKTCGTPCSYRGEFWLDEKQFVFIQTHEYYPPSGEIRCSVDTKCTEVVSISLYNIEKNTETVYESAELNKPIILPSWLSRDLQIKAACEGLYGKGDPACQQSDPTADWQTYKNEKFSFEFKYPGQKISIDNLGLDADGFQGFNFMSLDNGDVSVDRNIDGGLAVYYNIPNVAYGSNGLEESLKSAPKGMFSVFPGFSSDYKWQCGDGQNKGGDKIRFCDLQKEKNVYEFNYNYAFQKVLFREDYDLIVKSFHFTK